MGCTSGASAGARKMEQVLSGIKQISQDEVLQLRNSLPEITGNDPKAIEDAEKIRKSAERSLVTYAMITEPYEPTYPTYSQERERKENGVITRSIGKENAQYLTTPKNKVEEYISKKAKESENPLATAKVLVEMQNNISTQVKRAYEVLGMKKSANWWNRYGDTVIARSEMRRYVMTGKFSGTYKDGLPSSKG